MSISKEAVKISLQKAGDQKFDGLTTDVADVNTIEIESKWDLIVFSQSLHHIGALEYVMAQVKNALTPDEIPSVSAYIGPTRMQWSDFQLQRMNDLLAIIPEYHRIELNIDGTISDRLKSCVKRIPLEAFERVDPSEAVRGGEIGEVIRDTFETVEFFPQGGAIYYELFRNIAHNFDDAGPMAKAILQSILFFEHELTQSGLLKLAFGVFICRKTTLSKNIGVESL